jgi:hypothetical protein
MTTSTLKPVITIENFPSRTEVMSILNAFLKEHNASNEKYTSSNKSNIIEITLNSDDLAYAFVKRMNIEKCSNTLYKNIKCSLGFKAQNKHKISSTTTKRSVSVNPSKTANNHLINKSSSYVHIHWKDITQKAGIIGNDSPYLPDEKYVLQEYHKNKRRWISKGGFNNFVGKATSNKQYVIKNYVQQTPSKPPVLHSFREVEKKKWMSQKGFINV